MLVRQVADPKLAQFATLRLSGSACVLDVRGGAEFDAGHVPGAMHIPHTRASALLNTIPTGAPVLVHCNSGARAAAAVSLLEHHGVLAFHVNDQWAHYRQTTTTLDAQS